VCNHMMPPLLHLCNRLAHPVDETTLVRDIGITGHDKNLATAVHSLQRHKMHFAQTTTVSLAVCEIFSIKEGETMKTRLGGCSRSLKLAPFDRSYTTFYWSAIVSIALSCTVFELFGVE